MKIAVEISLYPLADPFVPPIRDFIERLNRHAGLEVRTNPMSTQLSGDIDRVFAALRQEIGQSFSAAHRSVFVMKVLGGGD